MRWRETRQIITVALGGVTGALIGAAIATVSAYLIFAVGMLILFDKFIWWDRLWGWFFNKAVAAGEYR